MAALAALVRDLNLEIYALRSAEASLEQLLGELAQQATRQPAGATTRQCLLAIHHCTTAAPDAVQVPARLQAATAAVVSAGAAAPAMSVAWARSVAWRAATRRPGHHPPVPACHPPLHDGCPGCGPGACPPVRAISAACSRTITITFIARTATVCTCCMGARAPCSI